MSAPSPYELYDCLVIGGGTAGLTAAIYLARFRRNVLVIDSGSSRAALIPTSRNYPGFIDGISGHDLLQRLRVQAMEYGAHLRQSEVTALDKRDGHFVAQTELGEFHASTVLMATGIVDACPNLKSVKEFVYSGAIRYCPICDGFEATDKRVGILGPWDHIVGKALFLRTYTKHITLLPLAGTDCTDADKERLRAAGLAIPAETVSDLTLSEECVTAVMEHGGTIELDILYPAMGAKVRSDLVAHMSVERNEIGCLATGAHQETAVPGLYAAGDVTYDLSQISVATGQAAIAATSIHNSLPPNPR